MCAGSGGCGGCGGSTALATVDGSGTDAFLGWWDPDAPALDVQLGGGEQVGIEAPRASLELSWGAFVGLVALVAAILVLPDLVKALK